jgi:hypothetical protein
MKNGTEIQAVISEITTNVVKYKRFDNPTGPNFTLNKSQISKVVYQNGTIDQFGTSKKSVFNKTDDGKLKYSGPRIGLTYLGKGTTRDNIADLFDRTSISPLVSQFGWQFETRFFSNESGSQGLVELIPMIGGLEQGLFLPSLTAIIGFRHFNGFEVGVGPSLSLGGASVVIAAGTSIRSGNLVFPINLAFVPSITKNFPAQSGSIYDPNTQTYQTVVYSPAYTERSGFRLTLTMGFNSRTAL